MMPQKLMAIVYVSTVSSQFLEADIKYLLEQSRSRNEKNNITGLLLYCHGTFMQYIEGFEESLLEIYRSIKRDHRHHGIVELVNTVITSREFKGWSMAYSITSKAVIDELSKADWLENGDNKSTGRMLLRQFWELNTSCSELFNLENQASRTA